MSRKPLLSARVPEDKAEKVEQFAEERGISKSDALRRLVNAGLEEIERDNDSGEDTLPRLGDALALIGALSWVASIFAVVPWLFLPGAASIIAAGLVFLVTGYGGGVLVGLGATLWMWSAAPDASLVDVARARVFSRAEVAK